MRDNTDQNPVEVLLLASKESVLSPWLAPDEVRIGPHFLRPFSFGSLVLCDALGMVWPERPTADDCQRIAGRWIWAHETPLSRVKWALHTGAWRAEVEKWDWRPDLRALAAEVWDYCGRTLEEAGPLWIECRPRPVPGGGKAESSPIDLRGPDHRTVMAADVVAAFPGMDLERVLWYTPLPTFLSLYHAAKWKDTSIWTVGHVEAPPEAKAEVRDQLAALRVVAREKAAAGAGAAVDRLRQMTERLKHGEAHHGGI
ncbi:MAG: hypothetical protein EBV03_08775 [Proteobacteria bacterium]|nr:hypothetical protein [Pseudomonadota bacterium]